MVDVEVLCGHDPEGADGSQRAAVLALQLVGAIAINDQLALLAARHVEVVHQAVARIVVVPVTLVEHARPPVVAAPLVVFARITPSSVRHRPLLAWVLLFGLSVKTPWQSLREVIQGSAEAPARAVAAFSAWSCENSGLRPLVRTSAGFGPLRSDAQRDRRRPRTASVVIRPKGSKGKLGCREALEDYVSARTVPPTFEPAQPSRHNWRPSSKVRPL